LLQRNIHSLIVQRNISNASIRSWLHSAPHTPVNMRRRAGIRLATVGVSVLARRDAGLIHEAGVGVDTRRVDCTRSIVRFPARNRGTA